MLRIPRWLVALGVASVAVAAVDLLQRSVTADTSAQPVPFSQNWTNTALITTGNDWSGVPGIIAYRGDAMVAATGVDPQTILADGSSTPVNVLANQTNPNTNTTGGVAEFELANPTIAFQGSGTARAPHIVITLNTLGVGGINVSYNLRDVDGSADNAVQPVAFQYRVGTTGNFINMPAGFVADASTGPSLATHVTPVSVALPPSVDNQPIVQVRIITSDAVGSDEWIGIDDITISNSLAGAVVANPNPVQRGATTLLTATVTPAVNPLSTGITVTADLTPINGSPAQSLFDDGIAPDLTADDNVFSFAANVPPAVPAGAKAISFTIRDAQNRSTTATINLTVIDPPPPPVLPVATLPFFEDWTNINRLTTSDDWSQVSAIVGYLGNDDSTTSTDVDPQTRVPATLSATKDVIANQTNTAISNGGVAEFELTDPTVALQGSGTADAPNIVISVNTQSAFGVRVAYDLRDIDVVDNAVQPVALQYRIGDSGNFTNVPAGFVPDATTGPGLATLVTHVSALLPADANDQPRVDVRIIGTNATGSDEWVGIDNISITAGNPSGIGTADPNALEAGETTRLSIAVTPGNNPVSTGLIVAANLSAIGGSAIQIFFDDGTHGDSIANDLVFSYTAAIGGATPPGGVVLSADIQDGQGRNAQANIALTIIPTAPFVAIAAIQGSGSASPIADAFVKTSGIVTGIKSNGFFIQSESDDHDPATSDGIFVFTSAAPSASVVVGNLVRVTGRVQEFVPAADPSQPPVTEIGGGPFVSLISVSHPLPAAVDLAAADTPATGGLDVLERFEGMRVHVSSLRVSAPTQGFVTESSATSTSNGVFYGVITGVGRPFREPGIQIPDPLPPGAPLNIPRFDGNPERLRVDSDGLIGGHLIDVAAGDEVLNLIGPLDYTFRTYQILPDPGSAPTVVRHNLSATPVAIPSPAQFTVASANVERFFDTVNDPQDDAVLTPAALSNRLNKVSLYVRDVLRTPDIIGFVEVENLPVLQSIAAKVNNDAVAAGAPNPDYQAFLVEGNDIGGIDSGFLVSHARVDVIEVTQFGADTTYIDPNTGNPALLNDRPPLLLRAEVHHPAGGTFPVTVIANHLRSLNGVDDPVDGNRVRTKRRAQAEYLAQLIQSRQAADPAEHIISVGDYNVFQFNDGFVDSIGTIKGTPAPADQVTLASADFVTPDLTNVIDLMPQDQRYSFSFDGNAQVLDHQLVTANLLPYFERAQFGRANADYPEIARNDPNSPLRISDHDGLVTVWNMPAPTQTLLASSANPSIFGQSVTFTATVSFAGSPVTEGSVIISDGGVPLATASLRAIGQVALTTSTLSGGLHAIAASYTGTARFKPSSASIAQVVQPQASIGDVAVTEGNQGTTTAVFTVALSAASNQPISIDFATSEGSAHASEDYASQTGTLAFAPGERIKTIGVLVNGDIVNEGDEQFFVLLSHPANVAIADGAATGTIVNDDPMPGLSVNDLTVLEPVSGSIPAVFSVSLSAPTDKSVIVDFATSNGSAAAGVDYVATSGTLSFAPGELVKGIPVTILADRQKESLQAFSMTLSGPVNATLVDPLAAGTIFDAAAPRIDSFAPDAAAVGAVVTITGENFAPMTEVTINGTPAAFRIHSPRQMIVTVPAGATSGVITVTNKRGTAVSALAFTVLP